MSEMRQCEFFLLRYVPDAVKDEFVNIGVVLLEAGANGGSYAGLRFTRDWSRVRCLDPAADTDMFQTLEALEEEMRGRLASSSDRETLLKTLTDSFSNTLQVSSSRGVLTESPQAELDKLAELYLETPARRKQHRQQESARRKVFTRMRDEFDRAGVWQVVRKQIPVAPYTREGDPLKLDCGYRSKLEPAVRLFHALSVNGDIDAAKALAFSAKRIVEGVSRAEQAEAQLTAVVDEWTLEDSRASFTVETLAECGIAVAKINEFMPLVERARRELQL